MVERKVVGRAQQRFSLLGREVGQRGHPCSHRGRVVPQKYGVPKNAQGEVQMPLGRLLVQPRPSLDVILASNMALMSCTWCPVLAEVDVKETQICSSMDNKSGSHQKIGVLVAR